MRRVGGSDTCVTAAIRFAAYAVLFATFAAWGFGGS